MSGLHHGLPGDGAVETQAAPAGAGIGGEESKAFTTEQIECIAHARGQARKVTRAASVAAVSGWTMAVFAALTLLSGLFSVPALLLGIGLGGVAYIELRGAKRLRAFEDAAPKQLALNQVALGGMLVLYGSWGIFSALSGPGPYDSYIAAGGEIAEMLEPIDRLTKMVSVMIYAVVILIALPAQGGLALYYLSRRRYIIAYLQKTPRWIVDTLRAAA